MYSISDVAQMLNLHPKTVGRFIREGRIKARKVGREWRITKAEIHEFTHGEESTPKPSLLDRIDVSTVIELDECQSAEVSRISNNLLALLNCKDPSWGEARYELLYHPESGKARFILNGKPAFVKTVLELLDVYFQENND